MGDGGQVEGLSVWGRMVKTDKNSLTSAKLDATGHRAGGPLRVSFQSKVST